MTQINRLLVTLSLLLAAAGARADVVSTEQGFSVSLPGYDSRAEVAALRDDLRERRTLAAAAAEESQLGAGGVLFSIVAPGGMLYAAHKLNQRAEAEQVVAAIDRDLALVEGELARLALVGERGPVVAQLH